jgi:hypothetical protein
MSKIETIYEIHREGEENQLLKVSDVGQNAAKSIDKKFKGKQFRKTLKGFNIDGVFHPFRLPKIYGRYA